MTTKKQDFEAIFDDIWNDSYSDGKTFLTLTKQDFQKIKEKWLA